MQTWTRRWVGGSVLVLLAAVLACGGIAVTSLIDIESAAVVEADTATREARLAATIEARLALLRALVEEARSLDLRSGEAKARLAGVFGRSAAEIRADLDALRSLPIAQAEDLRLRAIARALDPADADGAMTAPGQGLRLWPPVPGERPAPETLRDAEAAAVAIAVVTDRAASGQRAALAGRFRSVKLLVWAACAGAVLGVLFIGWRLEVRLLAPLRHITRALSGLSRGIPDLPLPEPGGAQEIDELVRAFRVFDGNARELKTAHEAARAAQRFAERLASNDALTGLYNRRMFNDVLKRTLEAARRQGSACSVLLIDLDGFKPINDQHGHAAGDFVLCEVARRLSETVSERDLVARLGGDEFAVLLTAESAPERLAATAQSILGAMAKPIEAPAGTVRVGASIGIAVSGTDGDTPEALTRSADLAMYATKTRGRNGFSLYDRTLHVTPAPRRNARRPIEAAIESRAIRPLYQPLVELASGEVRGCEILARWFHEDGSVAFPADFLESVETAGLLTPMTRSLLDAACRESRVWPADLGLALNVTAGQIADPNLPDMLFEVLESCGISGRRLEVEITEGALIADLGRAKSVVRRLKRSGVRVVLDDFGMGYSNLRYLVGLDVDRIKIDRYFVRALDVGPAGRAVLASTVHLARGLGIGVTAEGIETKAQLDILRDIGCELGQGYYLGAPAEAAALRWPEPRTHAA